ncbi:type IV secretory system conjugative DNA transfer family protein [Tsukamurella paurometabola]|uniref:Type IV secretory system conjugative DNA transfer family protein n=1 Tax=Tsukamurella paurometabola TaxID=2061 RepID=A0ABS5NFM1_TSUPA|nr:type IV secretory system conjugative DNA transfer family protein [Tsukamurella paurometabola]MBS4103091.1 type IV secretory system conjugative DNA transfer family protein [Tsukamurella paurometabola]
MRTKKTTAPAEAPDEPYAGRLDLRAAAGGTAPIILDEANAGLCDGDIARTSPHLLVVGKTGSMKSSSVLEPNIIRWGPRPVVAMSSKADVAEHTITKRARRGPVFLLDLAGEVSDDDLRGVPVTPVRVDPCTMIETDDQALSMASLLMQIGDIGAGGDGQGGGDSGFWKSLARRRLACFLLAGGWYVEPATGKKTWGGGIAWALDAAEDVGPDAAEGESGRGLTSEGIDEAAAEDLDESLDDTEISPDFETPNWNTAYLRVAQRRSRHAKSLLAARAMDSRQRDSIGINMQVALSAWAMEQVAQNPSVRAFHPSLLEQEGATLYIVSGMEGAGPPAIATVLIEIVNHWRKPRCKEDKLPPVLFVLDEFANGAQIPPRYVNRWISEGRGLGIRLVLALQTTKQLNRMWGQAAADELRALIPAALILPGAGENQMIKDAAETTPPSPRSVATIDAGGRASTSEQMVQPTLAELLPRKAGEGRLLLGGMAGVRVRLRHISGTNLLD